MRALQLVNYGEPEEALEFRDIEVPDKGSLGSTEIYVKVRAVSINPVDWKIVKGMLKPLWKLELPATVGFDVSGTVEAVGSSVEDFVAGDEIISRVHDIGTFQEYVIIDQKLIAKKPASVGLDESAGIPLAAQTALQSFEDVDLGNKKVNKTFVPAGLGGVGSYATQILSNVYKLPVATTVSTGKVERMKSLVPNAEIIDYKKEDYAEKLSGIDFVLDTTGDLGNEAKVVSEGATVRSIAATPQSDGVSEKFGAPNCFIRWYLDFNSWMESRGLREKKVDYKYFWLNPTGERLGKIVRYIEEQKVQVVTDRVYEWADAKAAFSHAIKGSLTGKIIVKVSSD